jgi:hypothetical protein
VVVFDPRAWQLVTAALLLARTDPAACDELLGGLTKGELRQMCACLAGVAARHCTWPDDVLRTQVLVLGAQAA